MTDDRVSLPPFPSQMPVENWRDPVSPTFPRPRTEWDVVQYGQHRMILGRFARDSARFESTPGIGPMAIADRDIIRKLTVYVLADKLPPEQIVETTRVVVRVPASWWDEFKNTYRNRWWLRALVRRRPVALVDIVRVVTVTVDLRRWRAFPEADVPFPREFGPVRFQSSWETHTRITDPIE